MSTSDGDQTSSEYIHLPHGWCVLVVDDEHTFQQAWEIVDNAYVCALDAEWEPYAAKPCASLVQAAVCTRSRSDRHVLLLDFEALHKQDLRRLLQRIFRDRAMLKVGYGLVMDLRAIAAGLGGEGAGCVSVVDPFIDIGSLHRALFGKGTPGVAKVEGKGLAGLVEAQLGQPLDKRLQCSTWSRRPLQPDQIAYAALDASVLLLLLDSFIAAATPAQPVPPADITALHDSGDGPADVSALHKSGDAQAAEQPCAAGSRGGSEVLQSEAPTSTEKRTSAAGLAERLQRSCLIAADTHSSSNGVTDASSTALPSEDGRGHAELAEDGSRQQAASTDARTGGEQGSAAEEAIQAAAVVWGSRLEVGSCAPKNRRDRDLSVKKLAAAEPSKDFGWPAVIPWQSAGGEPRFACDVMTEGLARQLRLCGLDATSAPEFGKKERLKAYRHLVTSAEAEGRIILTADATFLRARYTDRGYLVKASSKREQLAEVLTAFNIKIEEDDLLSRCTRCNGTFIPRPLTWAELPSTCGVSENVEAKHSEFWMCSNKSCQKVYWQGFQYGNAMENLTRRILGSCA